jgi:hypothetical protein
MPMIYRYDVFGGGVEGILKDLRYQMATHQVSPFLKRVRSSFAVLNTDICKSGTGMQLQLVVLHDISGPDYDDYSCPQNLFQWIPRFMIRRRGIEIGSGKLTSRMQLRLL